MLYILYTPILKTSKFWSLEHVVNFTLIPKLWILRHVVHVTHAPTLTLQFFEIGACFILYTCPTLILQILELGACCILYTVHAQPKTSRLHSLKTYGVLSMWCIFYTCPTLVPSKILEFGECCIFYNPGHQNFGFWSMLYILHMPSLAPTNLQLHMLNSALQRFGAWSKLFDNPK